MFNYLVGLIRRKAYNRAKYQIIVKFNSDKTVTLTAPDPSIKFSQKAGTYSLKNG